MSQTIMEKIEVTKQRYLKKYLGCRIPERIERQLVIFGAGPSKGPCTQEGKVRATGSYGAAGDCG